MYTEDDILGLIDEVVGPDRMSDDLPHNNDLVEMTKCQWCSHFVEPNPDPEFPDSEYHWHLGDGEKEHDHDAWPGTELKLRDWKIRRPDLFMTYSDGKIGPNSRFHKTPGAFAPCKKCGGVEDLHTSGFCGHCGSNGEF